MVMALPLVCGALALTGCTDYEDDINGLGDRLTALEGTVTELKSQIENGKIITGVENTENGVKVTMSDGSTFEVKNGQNGTPGSVVTIGDNGNWFIDGVDQNKPSRGPKGDDGQAGQDATQIYYKPGKDGFWIKVTVEPGKEPVEEPTQESWAAAGNLTAVWDKENGTLTFANVEGSEEPIVINLTTMLRSLAFVPEVMAQGQGLIEFYSIYDIKGKFASSNQPKVTYRLNPQNADVKNVEWSFIDREVETRVAGDNNKLISIVSSEAGKEGGYIFEIKANTDNLPVDATAKGDQVLVALQASNGNENIVSDYTFVQKQDLEDFKIINKEEYEKKPQAVVDFYPVANVPATNAEANLTFIYNQSLDINKYLETYEFTKVKKSLPEIYVYPEYSIKLVDKYLGEDGTTDQQKFVSLDENGILTVNSEWLTNGGKAAIGRTPLIKVQSLIGAQVIAEAYIKVKITDENYTVEPKGEKTFVTIEKTIEYTEIDPVKGVQLSLPWDKANAEIFEDLGMSYAEFANNYMLNNVTDSCKVENAAKYADMLPAGIVADGTGINDETSTNVVTVNISNAIDENTYGVVKVVIPAKDNNQNINVAIEFKYTIEHAHEWPDFNPDYTIGEDMIQVKGKLVGGKWAMNSTIKEHFQNYLDKYEDAANHETLIFRLPTLKSDNKTPVGIDESYPGAFNPQKGAAINGNDWTDQEIVLTAPLEGEQKDYIVSMSTKLANGNYCEEFYTVRFISPFLTTANAVTLKTFAATPDSKDLKDFVIIKDRDNKVIYEKGAVTTYGADTYKLADGDFTVTYKLNADQTFGGNLTLNGTTVTWDNDGADLQQNKTASYTVTVEISNICKLVNDGVITVLSTANSK